MILGALGGKPDMDLEALYTTYCGNDSDISLHLPALRKLAEACQHVTEFGVRSGCSTIALLVGCKAVHSYDIIDCRAVVECPYWQFIQASSLAVEIEPTDLLFVDSAHTYSQLSQELKLHAGHVRKWIALHDTETYGHNGDDGSAPGLLAAVAEFLEQNPEWKQLSHEPACNGFTVLERC